MIVSKKEKSDGEALEPLAIYQHHTTTEFKRNSFEICRPTSTHSNNAMGFTAVANSILVGGGRLS